MKQPSLLQDVLGVLVIFPKARLVPGLAERQGRELQHWLKKDGEPAIEGLLELHMIEAPEDGADDALVQWPGHELQRNYVMPGELEAIFEDLGA